MPEDPTEGRNGDERDYSEIPRRNRRGDVVDTKEVPTEVLERRKKVRRVRERLRKEYEDRPEVHGVSIAKARRDSSHINGGSLHIRVDLTDMDFASEIPDSVEGVDIETTRPVERHILKASFEPASMEMIREWCERRGMEIEVSDTGFTADESRSGQILSFGITESDCWVRYGNRDMDLMFAAEADLDDVRISGNRLRIGNTIIGNRRGK